MAHGFLWKNKYTTIKPERSVEYKIYQCLNRASRDLSNYSNYYFCTIEPLKWFNRHKKRNFLFSKNQPQ
jgi:hypothetical protein